MRVICGIILALFISFYAMAQTVINKEVDGAINWSSYGTTAYVLGGAEFEAYFHCMLPQFTNHIVNWGRGGSSWDADFQSQEEKWCLPWWNAGLGSNYNWVLANDNGGYSTTNQTFNAGTNIALAPAFFYNGTAITNEGYGSIKLAHYFMGRIPANTAGGDGGSVVGNTASIQLNQFYNTPQIDLWHLLYPNGLLTVNSDFYGSGHPGAPGSLGMGLLQIIALGYETNVSSLLFNYATQTATTNHCTASSISTSGLSLTSTIHFDRMPPAWDVPNGTVTNDARNAFVEYPALGNSFNWIIAVTNLPSGTWDCYIDGTLTDSGTSPQWALGRNWFTNYNGQLWSQRVAVLDWVRHTYGVNTVTLENAHNAGSTGFIPGVGDLINYQSIASGNYDTSGLRGSAYVASMATPVSNMYQYNQAAHDAAQQTNHTILFFKQGAYSAAPFRP